EHDPEKWMPLFGKRSCSTNRVGREVAMPILRQLTAALALAFFTLGLDGAAAQEFPSRIIRMVVAFPPGGPTDFVARLVADKLKPILGQSVVIENKPGANGAIGADYVARGESDGHLLFMT